MEKAAKTKIGNVSDPFGDLVGGEGDDYLMGGRDRDTLLGGVGSDYLSGDEDFAWANSSWAWAPADANGIFC